jgi:antitoxin component YwqK of YwqJK toxin-antitoxin module
MKTYPIFIVLLILLSACSEYHSENLKLYHLRGEVKAVSSKKFNAEEKLGEVVKSGRAEANRMNRSDFLTSNSLIEFDKSGDITTVSNFNSDDELFMKTISEEGEFNIYDSKGNLQLKTIFDQVDFPSEATNYLADGSIYNKMKFAYNEDNQVTKEESYNNSGELIEFSEYKYEDGLLSEMKHSQKIRSNIDDVDFNTTVEVYEYNENDDIIKKVTSGKNKETEYTYTIDHDQHNNWIKYIQFKDEKATYIVEREITYY